MSPADFKAKRKALGLSAEGCARAVGAAEGRLIRRWESGERDIPWWAWSRLERLALADAYLIATDHDGEREYVLRIKPPGFIAKVWGRGAMEELTVAAWLDPQPEPAEAMRLLKEAAAALEIYTADSAAEMGEP